MSERLDRNCQLFHDACERFQTVHKKMDEELKFCRYLDHYEDDQGPNKTVERVQPRGREVKQLSNHVLAQISNARIYLDVQPVGNEPINADLAEIWKGAIRKEIEDPDKDFDGSRDRALMQAVDARMGYVAVEFDPNVGVEGEIQFRNGDGRYLMWADGHSSPHDPRCPWVLEVLFVPVGEVENKRGWKNNKGLIPDDDYLYSGETVGAETRKSIKDDDRLRGKVCVAKLWERNVTDTKPVEKRMLPLAPEKQFMQCADPNCGQRGHTLEELQMEMGPNYQLPAVDGCPKCGGIAEPQVAELETDLQLANRRGKRLTLFSPFQKREFAVLNEWPHDLPTVPYGVYKWEEHPTEPYGVSLTYEHWTMQLAADMVTRLGLEHMILAKPYTLSQEGTLFDPLGNDWAFDPAQGLHAVYRGTLPADKAMHMFQAAGLPPAWNALDQSIQGRFNAHTGTSDLSLTQKNSKDIPASTISQYIEQGELPVQHLITRVRRTDTVIMRLVAHLIRKTWTSKRWVDYQGPDGMRQYMEVAGDDLPDWNVVVTANPEPSRIDEAEVRAWGQMVQVGAQYGRAAMEFVGKRLRVPASEMRRLGDELEARAAQQQAQEQQMRMQQDAQKTNEADRASVRKMTEMRVPRPAAPGRNGGGFNG